MAAVAELAVLVRQRPRPNGLLERRPEAIFDARIAHGERS
jgi:hypothetical protein